MAADFNVSLSIDDPFEPDMNTLHIGIAAILPPIRSRLPGAAD
jgi:hypothetical protein